MQWRVDWSEVNAQGTSVDGSTVLFGVSHNIMPFKTSTRLSFSQKQRWSSLAMFSFNKQRLQTTLCYKLKLLRAINTTIFPHGNGLLFPVTELSIAESRFYKRWTIFQVMTVCDNCQGQKLEKDLLQMLFDFFNTKEPKSCPWKRCFNCNIFDNVSFFARHQKQYTALWLENRRAFIASKCGIR